jgi:hypothetical protein
MIWVRRGKDDRKPNTLAPLETTPRRKDDRSWVNGRGGRRETEGGGSRKSWKKWREVKRQSGREGKKKNYRKIGYR